jgi:hypothetical protein
MQDTTTLGSLLGQGRRSNELLVVSSLEKTGTLRKGTIIVHDTANESILLQVSNKITWADISEQDLLLMSENERLAYKIIQRYPKSYILRCIVVGAIRDEGDGPQIFSEPISFMSEKTSEVRSINPREQDLIYKRGPLLMGTAVDGSPVTFPINGLLQRHLSVVGMTGCGKSYLIGLLCEELAKHKAAILIIDPHNEYIPMAQSMQADTNKMLYSVGRAVGLTTYTLDVKKVSAQDFQHFTGMGEGSTSILDDIIHKLRKGKPHYTISDLLKNLESVSQSRSASEGMAAIWARNYLRTLAKSGFIDTSEPPLKEMVKPNQVTVVAMSGIKERIQQFVVTSILQRIFNARKNEEIPPLVVVIEEAHRFAPSAAPTSSSTIIRTLASEGRKFGTALVVVSQRPNRLDSTVLSQCVTNIVMKVKNPADLASIRESAENVTDEVIRQFPRFEKGEALVMGEAFPISLRFKVRSDRKTIHGGKNVDFQGRWLEKTVQESVRMFEFPDEL